VIQPSEFLKIIGRSLMGPGQVASDDQKIEAVGCWLKTGSPAETWFNKTSTPKTKYADFAQAFKTEFKDVEKAEKSVPELEREISEMRIKTEDLGRSEKYRGQDVYTHVIFAEKILDLAKRAKIDNTTSGLFNVRDKLPEVLREKVPEDQASWMAFADAIKKVDMGHIREGVRKHKDKAAETAKLQADIELLKRRTAEATSVLNSPTKAIRDQMNRTTISQQSMNRAAPMGNPFAGNSGGRGNLFNTVPRGGFNGTPTRPPRAPASEDEKEQLRASLALYLLQPDTTEGRTAYGEQMRTWKRINGDSYPSKLTGFPLCPGGAQPGSGECYACGKTGHRRRDCTSAAVPNFESSFRAICGSILAQPRYPQAQINHVGVDDEFGWANASTSQQSYQGNEDGPSAL